MRSLGDKGVRDVFANPAMGLSVRSRGDTGVRDVFANSAIGLFCSPKCLGFPNRTKARRGFVREHMSTEDTAIHRKRQMLCGKSSTA